MKTLDEIGIEQATDKSSLNHRYLSLYEMIFEPMRNQFVQILEIGVQFGNSLRTWREYFPNAYIIGIDSVDNNVSSLERTEIIIADAYSPETVSRITGDFEIIIDDGSHDLEHQKFFVQEYTKLLKPKGILIVEDVLEPEMIPLLGKTLPEDFRYFAVDMTEGDSQIDSRLFIARRKNHVANHLKSMTY